MKRQREGVPLCLYVADELYFKVARTAGVPGQLRSFFQRLDADMAAGIELHGETLAQPDQRQRREYVLAQVLWSLEQSQPDFAQRLLGYLALNWPELRAIYVDNRGDHWELRLDIA